MAIPASRAITAARTLIPASASVRCAAKAAAGKARIRTAGIQLGIVKLVASFNAAAITPAGKTARSMRARVDVMEDMAS